VEALGHDRLAGVPFPIGLRTIELARRQVHVDVVVATDTVIREAVSIDYSRADIALLGEVEYLRGAGERECLAETIGDGIGPVTVRSAGYCTAQPGAELIDKNLPTVRDVG
jgi:predicted solute-binding protein